MGSQSAEFSGGVWLHHHHHNNWEEKATCFGRSRILQVLFALLHERCSALSCPSESRCVHAFHVNLGRSSLSSGYVGDCPHLLSDQGNCRLKSGKPGSTGQEQRQQNNDLESVLMRVCLNKIQESAAACPCSSSSRCHGPPFSCATGQL